MKTLLASGVLALAAAGCGVAATPAAKQAPAAQGSHTTTTVKGGTVTESSTKTTAKKTPVKLPSRPAGQLVVDGFTSGSLTQSAYQLYENQGGTDSVTIGTDGTPASYQALCTGEADIVDASTSIDKAEQKLCHANGIVPVQLEVASNAVVLATENETDVGADCLTMSQVRAIFRAGSPVENWQQLGFDDVPLTVAGPNPSDPNFEYFGQFLVNSANPGSEDFRFDYNSEVSQTAIRKFVTGTASQSDSQGELAEGTETNTLNSLSTVEAYLRGWRATYSGAISAVRAYKHTKKPKQAAASQKQADNALHQIHLYVSQQSVLNADLRTERAIQRGLLGVLGHLGVFEYGYYTLFEQQLRPLEITAKANPENCVFPSQATITSGDYPLSRQLLLTFSLQQLRKSPSLRQFLISYLKNASTLAAGETAVPLPANVLTAEEQWLAGGGSFKTQVQAASPPINEPAGAENSMSGTGNAEVETAGSTVTTPDLGGVAAANSAAAAGNGAIVPSGVH